MQTQGGMHTDTSHIGGRGRPGRSGKPIADWAVVALLAVAITILMAGFFVLSPYLSEEATSDDIVPAEPAP